MYKSKQFKGKKRGILCEQKGKSRKMRLTQKGRAKQVICKVESQNQKKTLRMDRVKCIVMSKLQLFSLVCSCKEEVCWDLYVNAYILFIFTHYVITCFQSYHLVADAELFLPACSIGWEILSCSCMALVAGVLLMYFVRWSLVSGGF